MYRFYFLGLINELALIHAQRKKGLDLLKQLKEEGKKKTKKRKPENDKSTKHNSEGKK